MLRSNEPLNVPVCSRRDLALELGSVGHGRPTEGTLSQDGECARPQWKR